MECIFCKEALRDISQMQDALKKRNVKPVFVHMTTAEIADQYFQNQEIQDPEHISDPNRTIYNKFGLTKGSFSQLLGLNTWVRGYKVVKSGIPYSRKTVGDSFQMPGIFMLFDGKIVDSYIHKRAADRPDYNKFLDCCTSE